MTEVQNDPDRVTSAPPHARGRQRRRRPSFERVSWDEALDDIGGRLKAIRERHGGELGRLVHGQPGRLLATRTRSGSRASSTGSARRTTTRPPRRTSPTASPRARFLYGSPFLVPIPDLARTDLLFVLGANPLVSHGSVMTAPRIKDQLHAITERGGRVVVVDPRRTRDGARVRARRRPPRLRRLAPALDAQRDLRRGSRGRGRDDAPGARRLARCASWSRRSRPRRPSAGPASRPRTCARSPATSPAADARRDLRAHRLLPRPQRHARLLPARRARARHRQPRPSRAAGSSATPPIAFDRVAELIGARRLRQGPLAGSATFPRCSARCRRR